MSVSIRDAAEDDAGAIAGMILGLGYDASPGDVRERLRSVEKFGDGVLLATSHDEEIIGVLTTSRMTVLHRPRPVGRISMLVVAEEARGQGVGRALVTAAEDWLRARGCGLIEVTSQIKREAAHRFYEALGYERTSARFAKPLV